MAMIYKDSTKTISGVAQHYKKRLFHTLLEWNATKMNYNLHFKLTGVYTGWIEGH
jgi:hypothetical protein